MLKKANEYIRRNHIDEKEKSLFHVNTGNRMDE